jgi:hypothetical protein
MTDTPAESAEAPRTPYPVGMLEFMDAKCPTPQPHGNAEGCEARDCAPCFAAFVGAALAARDAEVLALLAEARREIAWWVEEHGCCAGHENDNGLLDRIDALLSEGNATKEGT